MLCIRCLLSALMKWEEKIKEEKSKKERMKKESKKRQREMGKRKMRNAYFLSLSIG